MTGVRAALLACLLAGSLTGVARGEPMWTTYHRDPGRSGYDSEAEEPVTPTLDWQSPKLDGAIWSQPLVLGDRVYVATVGDELYALEASTGKIVWQQSAGAPVPSGELPCGDIEPTVGIVGTPVIDTSTGTIYAVANTWIEAAPGMHEAEHVLKGYRLSNGEEVLSTPVDPPGSYHRAFLQRTALNLDKGVVIFGFGGNDGDCSEYRGTVVAAPLDGGAPRFWQVPIALPSEWGGAVWAPSGPAVDGTGNVYATTGNPDPPAGKEATIYDYSDSVVKLNPAQDFVANPKTEAAAPLGFFEPPNWEEESNNDLDLSSAGAELLPGGLLFQAGKDGRGYLIEEASMHSVYSEQVCSGNGSFGGDAYASGAVSTIDPTATGTIYIPCTTGTQALAYNETGATGPSFTPLWQGPPEALGPPIVSAGLVWSLATPFQGGEGKTLYGLYPATGVPRYTETLPSPVIDHFASPSAAGGRLFVSTGESVTAYQIAQLSSGETSTPVPGGSCSAACPPTGGSTGSTSATTSSSGGPAAPSTNAKSTASVPTLLHTHLRANARGRVRMALRCPAAAVECRGTVTLTAEIVTIVHRGKRRIRRVVAVRLARARFGPSKGEFTVVLRLSRGARALLRRHYERLAVRVVITSAGGGARGVVGVLTQAP